MNINIEYKNESDLRKLFSWQARVGLAPKFGSRPIGWYQQHHCKVHEILLKHATNLKCYEARCSKGDIYLGKEHIASVHALYTQADAALR